MAMRCPVKRILFVCVENANRSQIAEAFARIHISGSTVWRRLDEHAIRLWSHRSWVFPRDPDSSWTAGRVLDLYGGLWEDEFLGPKDYVLCADEKTGIQIRRRIHPTHPAPASR
jgi:hypothetical protein